MVNISNVTLGKGPHLIYGVKRGKVPTKLRSTVVPTKSSSRGAACVDEMFKLLGCWKRNAYADAQCSHEVNAFLACAEKHVQLKASKAKSDDSWTSTEVNNVLKQFSELKGARSH
ncbi:coiled-coil-helix-coiled-coil-helix domain-containing protein 1 [Nematostella vectensis]|uniref:coiled-coil-helix-coiled-coil-helix domain-containing protein 1 n=1 Tax=Nematostella vectensis TaxID=45351 RepID=UPI00139055F9|nr:coiled-coil-helix-coiled-coil-helix domain-containing protein 1 [Nematostella vectensis]